MAPPLLLALLGLAFFAPLAARPTQVLYSDHSDFLAHLLPYKRFLVHAWHADGELPLWNPYVFAGMPLVHDIQATLFYPPQAVLYLVGEDAVGPALSWLVVLHVVLAGWCMYAYARWRGLTVVGALVAAVGWMFGGKWMLHLLLAAHQNLAPLAWLPLAALFLEQALDRAAAGKWAAALLRGAWSGAAFALIALGTHPQLILYAGLFFGAWTLGPALEQAGWLGGTGPRSAGRLGKAVALWLGLGAWAAAWGVALAAVQLLPTLEASRLTTRAVADIATPTPGDVLWPLSSLAGPPLGNAAWEQPGGLGLLWLIAAVLAPELCRGRTRYEAVVWVLLLVFAVGGGLAVHGLPVFRLFRIPSRMFLMAAFPTALLAGRTTDALVAAAPDAARTARRRRAALIVVLLVVLCLADQALLTRGAGQAFRFRPYWAVVPFLLAGLFLLLGKLPGSGRLLPLAWGLLLLADLWALAWPLVRVRPEAEVYTRSECVALLPSDQPGRCRVLDRHPPGPALNTPLSANLALYWRVESVRGYNPLDVLRFREYLHLAAGQDRLPRPDVAVENFAVKEKSLLDLLGVRYLLQPSSLPPEPGAWKEMCRDDHPEAPFFLSGESRELPPYTLYENPDALPRAFVVPQARPLPERSRVPEALAGTDFRRTVLLEGEPPAEGGEDSPGWFRPARLTAYRPNRVDIEADGPGWLVLADVDFPGWRATVDGEPAEVRRADFLFRAVRLPPGAHAVSFRFEPDSYYTGRKVSAAALIALVGITLLAAGVWAGRASARAARS